MGKGSVESTRLISCHDGRVSVHLLELYRRVNPEGAVPSAAVVEDLDVLEDRVRELDPGPPSPAVEQFDLHPGPERLDDGVDAPIAVK